MSKTAQMVLKIVAAGLAFAALVCLKERLRKRRCSESDDYNDAELYQ